MSSSLPSFDTLTELLLWRAKHTPEQPAFIAEGQSYTYGWMWERIESFASSLVEEGVRKNERILLLSPNKPVFFIAFYGAIHAGAIAVPLFPMAGIERCGQIMKLSGSHRLILPIAGEEERKAEFQEWSEKNSFQIHWVDESPAGKITAEFPTAAREDVAFIQYTSGSTSFPKGVPLSHGNLLRNVQQMVAAMHIIEEDTFVSWLPVYHDMGLILMTMAPFYTGAFLVLLEVGLHRMGSWLKAIETHRGTFVAAPDMAYRLCAMGIRHPENYDISSLRVALNASERVRGESYELFEDRFGLKNVMISGYGLAEATVGVSMHPPGTPRVTDNEGYVASGKPLEGIDIRIDWRGHDPEKQSRGEILVSSPCLMKGYFNNEALNPIDDEGYLRTGDIGYLDQDRNLFVLARKKNCIKHAGHTIYPDDVEEIVKAAEGIRKAAALGIAGAGVGGESLHVFAETNSFKGMADDMLHELGVGIVQRIHAHMGVRPGRVYLLKPKSLPHTPNGKLQHARLKSMYLEDQEAFREKVLYPRPIQD